MSKNTIHVIVNRIINNYPLIALLHVDNHYSSRNPNLVYLSRNYLVCNENVIYVFFVCLFVCFFFLQEEVKRLANKVANLQSRLMKDKNKHIKSASNSLSRIRSSTNDEHCDDHTQKKMSSSPFSSFLNSRV